MNKMNYAFSKIEKNLNFYIGKEPRPGASRYVRNHEDGSVDYLYATVPIKQRRSKIRFVWLLLIAPILVILIMQMYSIITGPLKIQTSKNDKIWIRDELGVIESEDEFIQKLEEFREYTGISVNVVTMEWSKWPEGVKLTSYVSQIYNEEFNTENHWLIVYSHDGYTWFWEKAIGSKAGSVFTKNQMEAFKDKVADSLDAGMDVDKAFTLGFNKLEKFMVKSSQDVKRLAPILLKIIAVCLFCYYFIIFDRSRLYIDYEFDKEYNPKIANKYNSYEEVYDFETESVKTLRCTCRLCGADMAAGSTRCEVCGYQQ